MENIKINKFNYKEFLKISELFSDLIIETEKIPGSETIPIITDIKKYYKDLVCEIDRYERQFNTVLKSLKPDSYYMLKINGGSVREYLRIASVDIDNDSCMVESIRITQNGQLIPNLINSFNYRPEYTLATTLASRINNEKSIEVEKTDWESMLKLVEDIKKEMNIIYK